VSDLDGTLWYNGEECHPDSRKALSYIQKRKIPLLIATGRRLRIVATAFKELDLLQPCILLNGSLGYDFQTEKTFFQRGFTPASSRRIMDIFTENNLSPCIYADDSYVYASSPTTSAGHLQAVGNDLRSIDSFNSLPVGTEILNYCVLGVSENELRDVAEKITKEHLGNATLYQDRLFGGHSLIVQTPNTSKWSGVEAWCNYYEITASRVIAVGDAGNDFELLKEADISIVVENSEQTLLDMADYTIPKPETGGWAQIVNYL
jgi:hypothetical protein